MSRRKNKHLSQKIAKKFNKKHTHKSHNKPKRSDSNKEMRGYGHNIQNTINNLFYDSGEYELFINSGDYVLYDGMFGFYQSDGYWSVPTDGETDYDDDWDPYDAFIPVSFDELKEQQTKCNEIKDIPSFAIIFDVNEFLISGYISRCINAFKLYLPHEIEKIIYAYYVNFHTNWRNKLNITNDTTWPICVMDDNHDRMFTKSDIYNLMDHKMGLWFRTFIRCFQCTLD